MRIGTWIAYAVWVGFFGVAAYIVALVIAAKAFGIEQWCLFEEIAPATENYLDAAFVAVVGVGLALVVAGPRVARRSTTALATVPITCFAAVVAASAIAAAIIGHQPCVDDGLDVFLWP